MDMALTMKEAKYKKRCYNLKSTNTSFIELRIFSRKDKYSVQIQRTCCASFISYISNFVNEGMNGMSLELSLSFTFVICVSEYTLRDRESGRASPRQRERETEFSGFL